MSSYLTSKQNNRVSSNSNSQTSYSNDDPRINKHIKYGSYQMTQPQISQSHYEYADSEPRQQFENRCRQNQSSQFSSQSHHEFADSEPRQHFENRGCQNQSSQSQYEYSDSEPQQHFESRGRQNQSSPSQYEYSDSESQQHFENRGRQNQSSPSQYESSDSESQQHFENRGRQNQSSPSQYESSDSEPQQHFENRDRQNQSSLLQQDRDTNLDSNTERNGERKTPTNQIASNIDTKSYTCPSCNSPFDYRNRSGRYTGKLPLILNCNHTVCQECIYKGAVEDSIICPICKNPSALIDKNHIETLYEAFSPNFYVFGMISFSKGMSSNSDSLSLVPVAEPKKNHNSGLLMERKQDIGQRCFLSCNNEADLRCEECNDLYCTDCFEVVHNGDNGSKSFMTHTRVPITQEKPTRELERSTLDEMDIEEFFCRKDEKNNLSKGRRKKGGGKIGAGKKDGDKKGGCIKGGRKKESSYTKTVTLSPELAALVGQDRMTRPQAVKKIWSIIKEKDLYDPDNDLFAICDDALMKVIGVWRFRTFGMMKYLEKHFI